MEDANLLKKPWCIYVGRFQPMHKGHYGNLPTPCQKSSVRIMYSLVHLIKVEKPKSTALTSKKR